MFLRNAGFCIESTRTTRFFVKRLISTNDEKSLCIGGSRKTKTKTIIQSHSYNPHQVKRQNPLQDWFTWLGTPFTWVKHLSFRFCSERTFHLLSLLQYNLPFKHALRLERLSSRPTTHSLYGFPMEHAQSDWNVCFHVLKPILEPLYGSWIQGSTV